MDQNPVIVSLKDLEQGNVPFQKLEDAFGPSSLGILVVKDLMPKFVELRHRVLSYASYLAALDPDTLDTLSSPEAKYLVGWSHGKETLKNGQYDTLKGSYYVNCAFYNEPALQGAPPSADFPNFPEYTKPNLWPSQATLPGLQAAVEELCTLIIDTAVLVARTCDQYAVKNIEGYEEGYLEKVVRTSLTTKARLLHYFPPADPGASETSEGPKYDEDEDSWCATHVDHGCLTGLTSALFIDESKSSPHRLDLSPSRDTQGLPPLAALKASPDPRAGLYIRSRKGTVTKVNIPADCLAFQTGEALEVITKGKFRAVPHFVKGPRVGSGGDGSKVARNTLAVFTQPNLNALVDRDRGISFGNFAREVVSRHG
ncbi:hypothetical protein MMC25_003429 [Agyrium rufum]|nr:hypothetical protein [Agyrium rufum]